MSSEVQAGLDPTDWKPFPTRRGAPRRHGHATVLTFLPIEPDSASLAGGGLAETGAAFVDPSLSPSASATRETGVGWRGTDELLTEPIEDMMKSLML